MRELAEKHSIPLKTAEIAFKTVFNEITEALLMEKRVEIRNFGSFTVKKYKGYKGRNPRSKKSIRVKAKRVPSFKPGKIKTAVNL